MNRGEGGAVVDAAERMHPASGVSRIARFAGFQLADYRGLCVAGALRRLGEGGEQRSIDAGQVHGDQQIPVLRGALKRRFESAERAQAGVNVAPARNAERLIAAGRRQDHHRSGDACHLLSHMRQKRFAVPIEHGFVAPHARAKPSREHESRQMHARMVAFGKRLPVRNLRPSEVEIAKPASEGLGRYRAVVRGMDRSSAHGETKDLTETPDKARPATSLNTVKPAYNQTNRFTAICFILASGLLAYPLVAAGSPEASGGSASLAGEPRAAAGEPQAASKAAPALSVVRIGKNGHLVRELETPGPAKGTVNVASEAQAAVIAPEAKTAFATAVVASVAPPAATAVAASAGPPSPSIPAPDVDHLIQEAASAYAVDPLLVRSVIGVESNFNARAVSPKGAQGLMQLIPATARRFGVSDVFDARQNIQGGVKYLRYLQDLFPSDLRLSLAAYNAGEGAVARFGGVPPYRETVDYVEKVKQRYLQAQPADKAQRSDGVITAQLAPGAPEVPGEIVVRHIEQFMDAEGRLYLRTR
jgi:soluble lytic murein transglycosylase-like protein